MSQTRVLALKGLPNTGGASGNSVTLQDITLELLKGSAFYAIVLIASGVNPNGFQQPATGERKVLGRKADVAERICN